MSESYKKNKPGLSSDLGPASIPSLRPATGSRRESSRLLRRINPLGMRVVVQLRKEDAISEGGLYLPEGAKQNMVDSCLAEVLEVASARDHDTDEEANISGIPLGAVVLIPKNAGVKVPWDDQLRIVETKEVLAIVNEIEFS